MGVTIHSPNKSIDLPYSRFTRLRIDVANAVDPQLGQHYISVIHADDKPEEWWQEYNNTLNDLLETLSKKYGKKIEKICDFLYASDSEGKISPACCGQVLRFAETISPKKIIGYIGWENPATVGDFCECLRDCVETGKWLRWL